jgi:hypothetical protein
MLLIPSNTVTQTRPEAIFARSLMLWRQTDMLSTHLVINVMLQLPMVSSTTVIEVANALWMWSIFVQIERMGKVLSTGSILKCLSM